MGTNITGTKQALLELGIKVESLKASISKAQRHGTDAMSILAMQRQLAETMDLVLACVSDLTTELENSIKNVGNS